MRRDARGGAHRVRARAARVLGPPEPSALSTNPPKAMDAPARSRPALGTEVIAEAWRSLVVAANRGLVTEG